MSELNRTGTAGSCSPLEGEPNRSDDLVGGHKPILQNFARALRKEQTPWEQKLWSHLKRRNLGGYKFRRQQIIGNYIADFFNAEKRLIVELDGSQHQENLKDTKRDGALENGGYHVLRIWNNDIDQNIDGVLTKILETLKDTPHRNAKAHFDSPSRGELAENGPTIILTNDKHT